MMQPKPKKKSLKKITFKTVTIALAIILINASIFSIFHDNKRELINFGDLVSIANKQSFGLFHDISDSMWKSMLSTAKQTSWYADPATPLNGVENQSKWLADNMNPNFECPHVERIGSGEGVKYVCYPQRIVRDDKQDCLVYSIGCAGDFHFEDALYKYYDKKCEIHIFDPADWTRQNDAKAKNIHYHPWGLLSSYDTTSKSRVWPKGRGGGFKTFAESLEILGHHDRTIDIFKIDCEGCEWTTHKDWIGFGFRQILMEIHGVPQPNGEKGKWFQGAMNVTDYFQDFKDNGYVLFNKDINPNGKALGVELSFLKLDGNFD